MARKTNKTAHVLNLLASGTSKINEPEPSEQLSKSSLAPNISIVDNPTSANDPLAGLIKDSLNKEISMHADKPENGGEATVVEPTTAPIAESVAAPIVEPVAAPIVEPVAAPIVEPVAAPIVEPVAAPIVEPVAAPIVEPVAAPIVEPVAAPIVEPVVAPIVEPVVAPIVEPVVAPIVEPVAAPIVEPVAAPIVEPVAAPIVEPVAAPIVEPIAAPIVAPIAAPIVAPVAVPVKAATPVVNIPVPEPQYRYINMMELLVDERHLEFMRRFDACTCERCTLDVKALAMSNLPPKYLVTPIASIAPLTSFYRNKYNIYIVTELTKACLAIINDPRH